MKGEGRRALIALLLGALVAFVIAACMAVGVLGAIMLAFMIGPLGAPVLIASPFGGAYLASRVVPSTSVQVGALGLLAGLTFMASVLLAWRANFPLIQGDALNGEVLGVILAAVFACLWLVQTLTSFRASCSARSKM